jgi:L-alanine-DL-glutamate epimerase-like enolase superfamily enzyme
MAAESRRRLRQLAAHLAPGPLPVATTATSSSSGVGGLTITSVESFRVECPLTAEQQAIMEAGRARAGTAPFIGFYNTTGVTRIRTSDPSITGYGWAECDAEAASELLLGQNPMEVERLLAAGLECIDPQLPPAFDNTAKQRFLGAENALWDVVGKACGRPLHQLWGSCRDTMALYLTTVWPYDAHQEDVTPEQQVADMVELHRRGGYTAFKIRIWRKNTMEDVRTVRLFKQALPHCQIMLDRTGDGCGHDWSHEEALQVARALKDAGATWLEECFRRDYDHTGVTAECVQRNAALTAAAPLPITGGEHQPISVYHDYLSARAFDIVQPHCANLLSHLRKIGGAAQLAGVDCILHGHHGMDLIG